MDRVDGWDIAARCCNGLERGGTKALTFAARHPISVQTDGYALAPTVFTIPIRNVLYPGIVWQDAVPESMEVLNGASDGAEEVFPIVCIHEVEPQMRQNKPRLNLRCA